MGARTAIAPHDLRRTDEKSKEASPEHCSRAAGASTLFRRSRSHIAGQDRYCCPARRIIGFDYPDNGEGGQYRWFRPSVLSDAALKQSFGKDRLILLALAFRIITSTGTAPAMSEKLLPIFIVATFVVGFPLLWIAALKIIARFSGWMKLAKLYPGAGSASGDRCGYASAGLRWLIGYNRCLTITVSAQGIYMRPMFVFRIDHAPILIPWDAVLKIEDKSLALFKRLDFTIRTDAPDKSATVSFYGNRLVNTLARHAIQQMPAQSS